MGNEPKVIAHALRRDGGEKVRESKGVSLALKVIIVFGA